MTSCSGCGIRLTSPPRICAERFGTFGSTRSMVTSRSRWRFFGQVRLVLLLSQMKPSLSSNQTGFNCTDPSARLVATVTRMGSAASFWTAGLSADAFLPPAIDGAGKAQRLDLDRDPAGPGALVILVQVPMGEVIDMVAP